MHILCRLGLHSDFPICWGSSRCRRKGCRRIKTLFTL